MYEVRFHGRGGQGAVVASRILARAAFLEGKHTSAFPFFGVERRGAPVTAFTRIDDRPVRIKSQIYEPDLVVVLDPSLLKAIDVLSGLKEGGKVLVNTTHSPEEVKSMFNRDDIQVSTVDATAIAVEFGLGSRMAPIVNTAIVGALARVSGIVGIDSVAEAIMHDAPIKKEENVKAARKAYEEVKE